MTDHLPTEWEEYLELLLKAYKALHPEKTKSFIFGNDTKGNGSRSVVDPNAMEIDLAKQSKGKTPGQVNSQVIKQQKQCQICAGKGFKFKAKTHNTADCYDKPGNEDKRPAPKNSGSSSLTYGQANKGGQTSAGVKKTFKARLLELLEEEDRDDSAPPAKVLNVNSASVSTTKSVKSQSAGKETTAEVNEVQEGPSRLTSQPRWTKSKQIDVDFLERL